MSSNTEEVGALGRRGGPVMSRCLILIGLVQIVCILAAALKASGLQVASISPTSSRKNWTSEGVLVSNPAAADTTQDIEGGINISNPAAGAALPTHLDKQAIQRKMLKEAVVSATTLFAGLANVHRLPKIYVYSLPKTSTNLENDRCVAGGDRSDGEGMFAMEIHIHRLLLRHPCRVLTPELADFFFVPAYPVCAMHNQKRAKSTNKIVDSVARQVVETSLQIVAHQFPWYNKSQGRDHIWVITHGSAAAHTPKQIIDRSIRLMSNGDMVTPKSLYQAGRDIVIPGFNSGKSIEKGAPPLWRKQPRWGKKRILAVFQGAIQPQHSYSAGVRQNWLKTFGYGTGGKGKGGRIIILEGHSKAANDFLHVARESSFCLCPSGWAKWTPRPALSLALGCVPAIFVSGIALPFADFVDWDSFAVLKTESDAGQMESELTQLELNSKRMDSLRTIGAGMLPFFTFDDVKYIPRDEDVTMSILISLNLRLNAELLNSAKLPVPAGGFRLRIDLGKKLAHRSPNATIPGHASLKMFQRLRAKH